MPSRSVERSEPGEVAHLIPARDLRRLVNSGTNLLVRGEKSAVAATVVSLAGDFPPPLITWNAGAGASLPGADRGTLVIYDVDSLDMAQQRTLFAWLENRRNYVRVITTVTGDLFARVAAGAFLDQLYYRLNTIVIDAVSGRHT